MTPGPLEDDGLSTATAEALSTTAEDGCQTSLLVNRISVLLANAAIHYCHGNDLPVVRGD
jgi:hypothetical protein